MGKSLFILKKDNIFYIVYDFHYQNFYPEHYYLYLPNCGLKFTLVKRTQKYAIYEWL